MTKTVYFYIPRCGSYVNVSISPSPALDTCEVHLFAASEGIITMLYIGAVKECSIKSLFVILWRLLVPRMTSLQASPLYNVIFTNSYNRNSQNGCFVIYLRIDMYDRIQALQCGAHDKCAENPSMVLW